MQILADSRVAVFGAGGVGGYVLEALARSGVGAIDVIDNDRHSVLVRVPQPELDSKNIAIDADRIEVLHFSENVWSIDNSMRSGEELIRNQLSEAMQRIQEDFEANEQYSKLAEASAEAMIAALIKGINPDIADLEVRVEFY